MMSWEWLEEDFFLPDDVCRLETDRPERGRTYVMYHGTTRQNALSIIRSGFRRSKGGMLGPGVYLSRDLQKASRYPHQCPESNRAVIRVAAKVGKVIAITYHGHPRRTNWHNWRYGEVFDTAWVPPNCGMVKSGLEEDCIWDPDRISITGIIYPKPVAHRARRC